ncbi:MAG TPA: ABC transporter permease [Terriglobales bacterium]|nr:ABC transporter permease [Terriglobales bacterium]
MLRLKHLWRRVQALWRSERIHDEITEELAFHIDQRTADNIRAGMSPEEARRGAEQRFGWISRIKEEGYEIRGGGWMESLLRDVVYGLRMLRKNPGFTLTALLSLTLGIGANTAIFSMTDALLLRWLPVHKPNELVELVWNIRGQQSSSFSYPVIKALEVHPEVFSGVCGFSGATFVVGSGETATRAGGAWVSGEFYQTLGLTPQVGRLLTPEDDRPGAPLVAVLSDAYWTSHLNRDPGVIGKSITVQDQPVTIVGVSPPGFASANVGENADLTIPLNNIVGLSPNRSDREAMLQAGYQWLRILARPNHELTRAQLDARLQVLWPQIVPVALRPKADPQRRKAVLASTISLISGATGWSGFRNQLRTPLFVLTGLVAFVLLIACANVANLLLARATARQREIAVRMALGAGRGRVVRQLLTESFLLALMGVTLGIGLAQIGTRLLLALVSNSNRPILLDLSLNWRVLLFTIAVGTLTGLLFGVAPAVRATAADPAPALKIEAGAVSRRQSRLAPVLVSLQLAFSLLLLIAAGLFVRTLMNLEKLDPGFRHQGVLLVDFDGRKLGYRDARLAAFYKEMLEAVRDIKGVKSVSLSSQVPLSGGYWSQNVNINGADRDEEVHFNAVSPGYFATLQTPLLLGRDFAWTDDAGNPPVAIVNQAFLRQYYPDVPVLGQHISVARSELYQGLEIVGVVRDAVSFDLRKSAPPTVFVSFFQAPKDRMGSATIEAYAGGSLSQALDSIKQAMLVRMRATELFIRPFSQNVEDSIQQERILAKLAGFFGVLALALAATGLYGLLTYMVARRTGEFGIRMALGARHTKILHMVLADAARLAAIGLMIGVPVAWWASRLVEKMMFGLRPTDPLIMFLSAVVLGTVAVLAALVPAIRACRLDPMIALRHE